MLPREWVFQAPEEDIGLDGRVILGTSETTGELEFGVQVKSKESWPQKDGALSVSGIRSDTVRYWSTRLFPTMLVLYDASASRGYWGWLYDIMLPSLELLRPRTDTVTLKVPSSSILVESSWSKVRKDIETFYENFVLSLSAIRLRVNALPTVHSLTTALDLLLTAEFESPEGEEEKMYLQLAQTLAHKEVLLSLEKLLSKFGIEPGAPHDLEYFQRAYRQAVATFIEDVDTLLAADRPTAVWTNPDVMASTRPKLIRMLSDLMVRLTGNLPGSSGERHDAQPNGCTGHASRAGEP